MFHVHFSRAFEKYSFYFCSFSHKKFMDYFKFFFFSLTGLLFRPVPTLGILKKSLTKKITKAGPPACLGLRLNKTKNCACIYYI